MAENALIFAICFLKSNNQSFQKYLCFDTYKYQALYFQIINFIKSIEMTNKGSYLFSGQALNQGDFLSSDKGYYYAVMQEDGNFVLYQTKKWISKNAVWASGTYGKGSGPYKVVMQEDGNLVIFANKKVIWASDTSKKGQDPYKLQMQNDRNLVLYDCCNRPQWSSKTNI